VAVEAFYLIFEVGNSLFALPQTQIQEVLPLPALILPPGLPPILAGFVNLDGQYLPVLELAFLFQMPAYIQQIDQHLLRLRQTPMLCLVKRVLELCSLPEPLPLEPDQSLNNYLAGFLNYRGQRVALISVEKLLLAEEKARIQALQNMVQQRLDTLESSPP
jgi:purine-binding chemotaxis protein CheW